MYYKNGFTLIILLLFGSFAILYGTEETIPLKNEFTSTEKPSRIDLLKTSLDMASDEQSNTTTFSNYADVATISNQITEYQRQFSDRINGKTDYHIIRNYVADTVQSEFNKLLSSISSNSSISQTQNNSNYIVNCDTNRNYSSLSVQIIKFYQLPKLLQSQRDINRQNPAPCVVLLFYGHSCPFSSLVAPHFNVLQRVFPGIKMAAINALKYPSSNTQYGVTEIPTALLFHNGRPAIKFNESEYTLLVLSKLITKVTGIQPVEKIYLMSSDFGGPIPSIMIPETDIWLVLSWIVLLLAAFYSISKFPGWKSLMEVIQTAWHEAQQHDHVE